MTAVLHAQPWRGRWLLILAVRRRCGSAAAPPQREPARASDAYSMDDFARVRKYDAHVHANTKDRAFLEQARADGFELLSINVDYPDFPSVALQHEAAAGPGEAGSGALPLGDHVLDEGLRHARAGPNGSMPAWRRTWRRARAR